MGDVQATIFIANLVKTRAPKLWKLSQREEPATFQNECYPWSMVDVSRHKLRGQLLFQPRNWDVNNGRDVLCLDLRHKAPASLDLGSNELFAGRNRLFRVLRAAEMPLAFSWEDFSKFSCSASFDYQEIIDSCTAWKPVLKNLSIIEAFESMRSAFPEAEHPEQKT